MRGLLSFLLAAFLVMFTFAECAEARHCGRGHCCRRACSVILHPFHRGHCCRRACSVILHPFHRGHCCRQACSSAESTGCVDGVCLIQQKGNDQAAEEAFMRPVEEPTKTLYGAPEPSHAQAQRLSPRAKLLMQVLKHRPDLRVRVARYAEAQGMGKIDPENLDAILQAVIQFLEKLMLLILQFI